MGNDLILFVYAFQTEPELFVYTAGAAANKKCLRVERAWQFRVPGRISRTASTYMSVVTRQNFMKSQRTNPMRAWKTMGMQAAAIELKFNTRFARWTSAAHDFFSAVFDSARGVSRIDDQFRVAHDGLVVVTRMIGCDQHAVIVRETDGGDLDGTLLGEIVMPHLEKRWEIGMGEPRPVVLAINRKLGSVVYPTD